MSPEMLVALQDTPNFSAQIELYQAAGPFDVDQFAGSAATLHLFPMQKRLETFHARPPNHDPASGHR
jgi:hypothetical protein